MADTAGLRAALGARIGAWGIREDLLADLLRGGVPAAVEAVLAADLTDVCPSGSLPWDVSRAHRLTTPRDVLLQVEDVVNVASDAPRQAGVTPCTLKVLLTDGQQHLVGVEHSPLGGILGLAATPGSKVLLRAGARLHRGVVLLTPSVLRFLHAATTNVWGEVYDAEVERAMAASPFVPPHLRRFEGGGGAGASANGGGIAGRTTRLPGQGGATGPLRGLGGISDLPVEAEDDDDDAVGLEALAQYEASVAAAAAVGGGGHGDGGVGAGAGAGAGSGAGAGGTVGAGNLSDDEAFAMLAADLDQAEAAAPPPPRAPPLSSPLAAHASEMMVDVDEEVVDVEVEVAAVATAAPGHSSRSAPHRRRPHSLLMMDEAEGGCGDESAEEEGSDVVHVLSPDAVPRRTHRTRLRRADGVVPAGSPSGLVNDDDEDEAEDGMSTEGPPSRPQARPRRARRLFMDDEEGEEDDAETGGRGNASGAAADVMDVLSADEAPAAAPGVNAMDKEAPPGSRPRPSPGETAPPSASLPLPSIPFRQLRSLPSVANAVPDGIYRVVVQHASLRPRGDAVTFRLLVDDGSAVRQVGVTDALRDKLLHGLPASWAALQARDRATPGSVATAVRGIGYMTGFLCAGGGGAAAADDRTILVTAAGAGVVTPADVRAYILGVEARLGGVGGPTLSEGRRERGAT
ncbi:hypothetical protein MMPV_004489 [Pyropia vietnamensis]